MDRRILVSLPCLWLCAVAPTQQAVSPAPLAVLPRLAAADLRYEGAFRLPARKFGTSDLNFSEGPLAYDPVRHSIFIVGHSHQQAIAEFAVPPLVKSTDLNALRMAGAPAQPFAASVLGRATGGNPQKLNRIGGLAVVRGPGGGPELLVNAYEYYDAPADNTHTTFVVRDATRLATSRVDGPFTLRGGAGHTSGWISPIPPWWRAALGGTHLCGQSSGIPIIGRCSVGPSAFAFDPLRIVGNARVPDPVPTVKLLDFSLRNPLHRDLSNSSRKNALWTHLSRATYGFVAPGTRTYVTLGHSGGHRSGVCYKCRQSNGNRCGGYCAPDVNDYYHHYWLWDVHDLIAVRHGFRAPHDVRPYAFGVLPTPFKTRQLGGGSFDPGSGLLYVTVQRADTLQGRYANPPVVVAFRIGGA